MERIMNKIGGGMKTFLQGGAIVGVLAICMALAGISQRLHAQQVGGGGGAGRGGAESLGDLRFRNLGPAVAGGRVAAVAGVPGNPNIIYVGAAGGGRWKKINRRVKAGRVWGT